MIPKLEQLNRIRDAIQAAPAREQLAAWNRCMEDLLEEERQIMPMSYFEQLARDLDPDFLETVTDSGLFDRSDAFFYRHRYLDALISTNSPLEHIDPETIAYYAMENRETYGIRAIAGLI